ncbi:MAG TPA: TIGR03905 family TSCPD domain-containing protein [Candidatus Fimivicinus intestinavium]|nr:TIGR03905 family TSCPD domain-containing protein [Candidatus Fimivicinus intestinavium]
MTYRYHTHGTCSREIDVELEDGIIRSVKFYGGCAGNLAGISKIVAGMPAQKVIDTFSGIRCGMKQTSCPDQLARAVQEALRQQA